MYYYILNPTSGKGAVNQIQDKLRAQLNKYGISGEFAKTTGPGDAAKMAKTAIEKGYTTIVAVGGDGTVNEVMNGITKENVALGIIPIGDTNNLANRLGIFSWQQACAVLSARRLTSFRLMAAGQHYFLSSLTLGFETDLDKRVDTADEKVTARVKQFGQALSHARGFGTLKARIQVDDQFELECDIFSLSVSNLKFVNPLADNRLVISISDHPDTKRMTSFLWYKIRGEAPLEETATTRFFAEKVLISTEPTTGIMIDGKVTGRTPVAIRLTDRYVRFITEKPKNPLHAD
jgi:diacylglycerol kinase (ATP)